MHVSMKPDCCFFFFPLSQARPQVSELKVTEDITVLKAREVFLLTAEIEGYYPLTLTLRVLFLCQRQKSLSAGAIKKRKCVCVCVVFCSVQAISGFSAAPV